MHFSCAKVMRDRTKTLHTIFVVIYFGKTKNTLNRGNPYASNYQRDFHFLLIVLWKIPTVRRAAHTKNKCNRQKETRTKRKIWLADDDEQWNNFSIVYKHFNWILYEFFPLFKFHSIYQKVAGIFFVFNATEAIWFSIFMWDYAIAIRFDCMREWKAVSF